MKKIFTFGILAYFYCNSVLSQTYCLGFTSSVVSPTQVDVTVSIIGSATFFLGTGNVKFTYNTSAISSPVLQQNLLPNTYSTISVTKSGNFAQYNFELPTDNTGSSASNTSGLTLGVIRFTIVNSALQTQFTTVQGDVFLQDNATPIFIGGGCSVVNVALPLDLLDFKANTNGKTNKLSWQTANEVNTQSFDIERSSNGKNFEKVGNVKSVGTAKGAYQFTDEVPLSGINYYRLKMMDIDGSFTYSPVRSIVLGDGKATNVSIAPNPAKGQVFVKLNADDAKAITLVLVDVTGKTILTERKNLEAGFNQLPLNVSNYPQGLYFLKIVDANTTETHRLVIGN